MEKGGVWRERVLRSISALNWGRLTLEGPTERRRQEWVWQKRLHFLIRGKGSRTKCGDPRQRRLPSSASGPTPQECPGSAGGCGLGPGSAPR